MKLSYLTKQIFYILIIYEAFSIPFFKDVSVLRFLGNTLFTDISTIYFCFVVVGIFKYLPLKDVPKNQKIIYVILSYSLYQIFIVLPLTISEQGFKREYILLLIIRFSFLSILFFYWFILPLFKKNNTPIKIIEIVGIILIAISIYKYASGIRNYTNSGESRLASGVSTIIFAPIIFFNFKFFGAKKNNYFFGFIALTGLIFANHRSGYISLAIISIINIFFLKKNSKYFIKQLLSVFSLVLFLFFFIKIPYVQINFLPRIKESYNLKDKNYIDRYEKNLLSFEYFKNNPINGSLLKNIFYEKNTVKKEEMWQPHNSVLSILASQGIVGFLFIFILFFMIIKIAYKNRYDKLSYQMMLSSIYYFLFSLANAMFFGVSSIFILCLYFSIILYRNKLLTQNKNKFILN
ncbi:MAG: O-antigen ligase family protein [Bacteroidetes bacterium]|nr:O-antigen ligase family protein [Bacteroidota bacterium]